MTFYIQLKWNTSTTELVINLPPDLAILTQIIPILTIHHRDLFTKGIMTIQIGSLQHQLNPLLHTYLATIPNIGQFKNSNPNYYRSKNNNTYSSNRYNNGNNNSSSTNSTGPTPPKR